MSFPKLGSPSIMRWSLYLLMLGMIASINHAAPFIAVSASNQEVFTTSPDQVGPTHGGIIVRSASELDFMMQKVIDQTFNVSTDNDTYMIAVFSQVINFDDYRGWGIDILTQPRIEVISTKRLSQDILCTDRTCTVSFQGETTISTVHSTEVWLSSKLNAAPFGLGVAFTPLAGYGFSMDNEQQTTVSQEFVLKRGSSGYVAIVNAQISAKLHIQYCKSDYQHCVDGEWDKSETGYHESVIMYNNKPLSIVALVLN